VLVREDSMRAQSYFYVFVTFARGPFYRLLAIPKRKQRTTGLALSAYCSREGAHRANLSHDHGFSIVLRSPFHADIRNH
jgi:hypothetical protein